jgi:hypothetical protein
MFQEREHFRIMKRIRCGSGLGDSLYLQGVVRILHEQGLELMPCTNYPEIFSRYRSGVQTAPFSRENIDIGAHYTKRKNVVGTNQWQDCCIEAGLPVDSEFRLDWRVQNKDLAASLKAHGKPILLVMMARPPMDRADKFGFDLLPDCGVIQKAIDAAKGKYLTVMVGAGQKLYEFTGIDVDLTNQTSITDLLDLGYIADRLLGYCSFFVPLAESLKKPAFFVWSRKGLNSRQPFIRSITPEKILSSKQSKYVIDDAPEGVLSVAIDDFLR